MKPGKEEVLFQADSSYKDLLLRKKVTLSLLESGLFVVGMLLLSVFFDTDSGAFRLFVTAMAIAVIGLAPFVYKRVLQPRYTLTKTHLIISISGKKRSYPLEQVEPIIEGRHVYRLNGKREALMVSDEFLRNLNERLRRLKQKGKRRS